MRQIIILILLSLIVYMIKKLFRQAPSVKKTASERQTGENMVKDPVCNLYIPESEAVKKDVGGKTVYFCSNKCAEEFENLSG